jgi:elongator complex protein 1
MLSNECTGFILSQNFLIFTNTTSGVMHELHIYDLNRQLPADHTKLAVLDALGDFNVRAVERGSRLVSCTQSRLVLQMPRGNLEGIHPRIILCKHIV